MNIVLIKAEEELSGVDDGSLLAGKSEKRKESTKANIEKKTKKNIHLCCRAVSKTLHSSLKFGSLIKVSSYLNL